MIQILLEAAKTRIPLMTNDEIAEACSEVLYLQNFEMLSIVNPDDVAELQSLLGVEVMQRKLIQNKSWLRRRTD